MGFADKFSWPRTDQWIVGLMIAGMFLFVLTQVIDFSAASKSMRCVPEATTSCADLKTQASCGAIGACDWTPNKVCSIKSNLMSACSKYSDEDTCASATACAWIPLTVFRTDVDWDNLPYKIFTMIIIFVAVYLVFTVVYFTAGRKWDRRQLISYALMCGALFLIYTFILQPLIPTLPNLSFVAYQLYSISPPALQALAGP